MNKVFEQIEIMIRCGWNIKSINENEIILNYPESNVEFALYKDASYFRAGTYIEQFIQHTDDLKSELKIVQDITRSTKGTTLTPRPKI